VAVGASVVEEGAARTSAAETGAAVGGGGSVNSIERLGHEMEFTPLAEMLTPGADVDAA
jgi:hypothetical protein